MKQETYFELDISSFGWRELAMAGELLILAGTEGLPKGFDPEGLKLWFNANSGDVGFTNSDGQNCYLEEIVDGPTSIKMSDVFQGDE